MTNKRVVDDVSLAILASYAEQNAKSTPDSMEWNDTALALQELLERRAEVATLREHLAEVNRLLSLNIAELEKVRTPEPSEQPSRITMINNQVDRELEGFSNAFAIRDRLKAEEAKERAQAPEVRQPNTAEAAMPLSAGAPPPGADRPDKVGQQVPGNYEAALRAIAYKPFGHAEASHREVLDLITQFARDALTNGAHEPRARAFVSAIECAKSCLGYWEANGEATPGVVTKAVEYLNAALGQSHQERQALLQPQGVEGLTVGDDLKNLIVPAIPKGEPR